MSAVIESGRVTPEVLLRYSADGYAAKPLDALQGADALVIITEWKAYKSPNLVNVKAALKQPVIFDGRNLYEPDAMKAEGFEYRGIGR